MHVIKVLQPLLRTSPTDTSPSEESSGQGTNFYLRFDDESHSNIKKRSSIKSDEQVKKIINVNRLIKHVEHILAEDTLDTKRYKLIQAVSFLFSKYFKINF